MSGPDDLDARLLAAHEAGDRAALVTLYAKAGNRAEAAGDIDRACFFWTHAYVFALHSGDEARAQELHARLLTYGREE